MAYIYLVTNKVNGKQYVGKTESTIDERWKEHCNDYKKERCEKRPLYNAMNKYGIDNFEIKELEYLKEGGKLLSDRETYWIEKLGTYGSNGYNATKGGDGKTLYNHQEIIELYQKIGTIIGVSKKLGCGIDIIRKVLDSNNINVEERKNSSKAREIEQYSLSGELLNTFTSQREAGKYIKNSIETTNAIDKIASKIGDCANQKRKTAYKYIWRYKEQD